MRTLLIALCALGTLIVAVGSQAAVAAGPAAADFQPGDHVDVISVSGLIDSNQAAFITKRSDSAESGGAEVVVIQLNSSGGVLNKGETAALEQSISGSSVPVAVWVGPS